MEGVFYIRGVFFQPTEEALTAAFFSDQPIEKEEIDCDIFSGCFDLGMGLGRLKDRWGDSMATDVIMTETELKFVKKYLYREDQIFYEFTRRPDDIWTGKYSGSETGNGPTACVLWAYGEPEKILPDDLREPPSMMHVDECLPDFTQLVVEKLMEQNSESTLLHPGEDQFHLN